MKNDESLRDGLSVARLRRVLISPSILSADFGQLNEEIASIETLADTLHVDVMDGHFVPNLTFGAPVVRCIRTKLPLHCHLMVENPEHYVEAFAEAHAAEFIFHIEASKDAEALIKKIRGHGMKAGVSLNPGTELGALEKVLPLVDSVLVMSVNPGFGGQEFMPVALEKIRVLREKFPNLNIAVDGGINAETGKLCREAGANILVAGSFIFKANDRAVAISGLR